MTPWTAASQALLSMEFSRQEYTEELYKKDLHDKDNHDGVITDLEPDILECEVKWALESITMNKAGEGDEIPVELFQILKDDAVKVLHSICLQIWNTQQWPQDWKRSVFIPIPKKGNAKECSNYRTIALMSHASKVVLKIPQARFKQYMNHELPEVEARFRKGRGTRDQIANICSVQSLSGVQVCDSMNHSMPGLPVITNSWSSLKLMSIESVMPSSHLILCRPLLLLPPILPNIRVFTNESTRMRWPKK